MYSKRKLKVGLVQINILKNLFESFYKNKKILITGGSGFIGSALTKELISLGARVYVLDDLSTGKIKNLDEYLHKIFFIREDIRSHKSLEVILNYEFPIIFHLAAISSVPHAESNPDLCRSINVDAFSKILEHLAKMQISSTVVFASSSSVYGEVTHSSKETDYVKPESIYAQSKLDGERLLKEYSRSSYLKAIALRYFNVFGEDEEKSIGKESVFSNFKQAFYNQNPIYIFGTGEQKRDYVHISKVIESNLLMPIASEKNMLPNFSVFNVASGNSISLFELINNMKQSLRLPIPEIKFLDERGGDVFTSMANIEKLSTLVESLLKMESLV